ncbi:MAG TPA: ATP-binding protein [Trebonia sp.]|nr:ATP-binding protein [Trebonia sp.]
MLNVLTVLKRASAWLRRHPRWSDWLLAAALLVFSVAQFGASDVGVGNQVGYIVVTVVLAATVIPRRGYPVAAFAVAAVLGAVQIALGVQPGGPGPVWALQPSNADLAILVLLYNLAAHRPRRESIAGLVVCLAGGVVAVTRWGPAQQPYAATSVLLAAVGVCGLALTAWVLGDSVAYRYRRTQYVALEERAARLEVERDAQARIAAAAERERELTERRARVVDEAEARLRGIERNLHDGAQVRLAALAMTLGEIKENLERAADPAGTIELASAAHRGAKETLAELRDLARGIHPAVLDRGLPAALAVLAEASAVQATATVDIARRPSPAIEAIAYYCAAELLANVAKHAGAGRADVSVREVDGRLVMSVTDDGAGGARLKPGGGLTGLADRVQTVDGRLTLHSPPGGPTAVTVELPVRA